MARTLGGGPRGRAGRRAAAGAAALRAARGAARLGRAAERDVPEDIRKMALASESLRRNADLELTLAHLLLDLTGAWY
jgi:hypothetical protein